MDKEFEEKCLNKRTMILEPSVSRIEDDRIMKNLTDQRRNNSEYFIEGAKNLLNSSTPLLAVLAGYFAMEHKTNQLLALHGYKVESHICAQIGLSRIAGRKDLAKKLSSIFALRQGIGYRMTLKQSEESRKDAEKTVNNDIITFIKDIDDLIIRMESK